MHVTYWNSLSWRDPYSLSEVDQRQRDYAALRGGQQVYTPEALVDGQQPFIGSDARAMAAALNKARANLAADPGISLTVGDNAGHLTVQVGPGSGRGIVWLFGFDPEHSTSVHGGENAGATIKEVNVVRSITRLGKWQGRPLKLDARAPAGTDFAVIVQATDGTVLGAASGRTPATRGARHDDT